MTKQDQQKLQIGDLVEYANTCGEVVISRSHGTVLAIGKQRSLGGRMEIGAIVAWNDAFCVAGDTTFVPFWQGRFTRTYT